MIVDIAVPFRVPKTFHYKIEKEEAEKKRKAAEKAQEEREKAGEKEQARYTTPSRAQGTQTEIGATTEFSG